MHSWNWNPGRLPPLQCPHTHHRFPLSVLALTLQLLHPGWGVALRVALRGETMLSMWGHRWGCLQETLSGVGGEERKGAGG